MPKILARRPRLSLLLAALLFAAAPGCRPRAEAPAIEPLPAKSNILLITVDTLRADHLSAYGYPRQTSPVIDRLAAEGVRFAQPTVQWPKTTPSFASIFTSTYPKDNGIVRTAGQPISCRFEMLAEKLRKQGYTTHAVVANAAVGSDFYFDQGFDTFIETWKLPHGADGADPNRAEAVTKLAESLLDKIQKSGKPYFLWVHYLDPHAPYTPPDGAGPAGSGEWRDKFQNDAHFDPTAKLTIFPKKRQQMMGIGTEQALDGREDLAFYVARYDAEIAYNDSQIGRLLEELGKRGLLRKTLTAFTSDHGESLGEHNYYFDHGRFSFETCLRVPLILHYPGVISPRVDAAPVELLDLSPTLLEAAGAQLPDGRWMQGRSLTPRLRGVAPPPPAKKEAEKDDKKAVPAEPPGDLAFAEAGWETHNKWQKVVRDKRFKLIYAQTRPDQRWIGGEGERFALFDLESDPGETKNVASQFPQDLDRLQRALAAWDRMPPFDAETEVDGGTCGGREMEPETEALLRSLGYL